MGNGGARTAVVIATAGRKRIIDQVLPYLLSQDYGSVEYHVIAPDADSLPTYSGDSPVGLHISAPGLTTQRNHALQVIGSDVEYVFYFDDDAIPHVSYVREMVAVFDKRSDVVAATGNVLADGAKLDRELPISDADRLFSEISAGGRRYDGILLRQRDLYGCNFGVRRSVLEAEMFDQALPSYGWLEDQDFARRASRHGRLALVRAAHVVHLGAKSGGRTDHRRLGYWQVCNPIYLHGKGSFTLRLAARQALIPFAANLVGSARPKHGWRRQRLLGNIRALIDAITAPADPRRAMGS